MGTQEHFSSVPHPHSQMRKADPFSVWMHPVDEIEPEQDVLSDAAEMLSGFLRAVASQPDGCSAGEEALAHIALAMPAQFPDGFRGPRNPLDGDYSALGRAFSRLFACISGGWADARICVAGIRAMAAVYLLRPDLLGGATMHQLGRRCGGVSRQAFCKHVRAIRDSHGGIRNRAMKSESSRLVFQERCKNSWRLKRRK